MIIKLSTALYKTAFLFVCLFLLNTGISNAQKFGHLNSAELLVDMPEVKLADTELVAYQKGLISAGEELVKAFKANYEKYVEEANGGTLSGIQMKQKETSTELR